MTSQKPQRRLPLAAAVCAALVFSLPACAAPVAAPAAVGEAPAKVEKNATTGIAKLTLTQRGLDRIELKTEPVTAGAGGVQLPYGALMYDSAGKTWVYTNPAERVYERQEVTVSKVEAGVVTATVGPPAGTQVVTVGAAELFGAEFNTGK
ncbi:hypothetical protein [Pseudarthrobacter sp. MM222]|uniref:hypothetical protein n=1 Tax=Pseudarthrobacter sp. MM222 TaxID=3018929 RepID=UPI00221E5348|nr:hypothetical protein [Pseudarthrobacter sp. MM222]CAI3798490.1 hypothetical protein NKCBBBOE_02089 [Pseudarthrobacter sp. MM222]